MRRARAWRFIGVVGALIGLVAPGYATAGRHEMNHGGRRVELRSLWASAELPETWAASPRGDGFRPKEQPDPKHLMGISVSWQDGTEADMESYLKEKTALSPAQRKTRGIRDFSAGPVRREGAWHLVETREEKVSGPALMVLHAVRPAPGGFYEAAYFGHEPYFSRHRAAAQMFLDTFRREPPRLDFARYTDPGGRYHLDAPSAPWTTSYDRDRIPEVRFEGPPGLGHGPLTILSLGVLTGRGAGVQALDVLKSLVRRESSVRIGELVVPAGKAFTAEVKKTSDTRDFPELAGRPPLHFHTRYAVLERNGSFYVLTLQTTPAAAADWYPAFRRALETLRFQ